MDVKVLGLVKPWPRPLPGMPPPTPLAMSDEVAHSGRNVIAW